MLKRLMMIVVILAALALPAVAQNKDIVVAVMPFAVGGDLSSGWGFDDSVLEGITQMFTDRLVKEKGLVLVERSRLADILAEQDFQSTDRVDASTAVEFGRMVGADVLVLGSVTQFGWKSEKNASVFGVSVSAAKAKVGLSARLVAVKTGQILGSLQSSGEKTGANLSVDTFYGLSFGGSEFNESIIGRALNEAMDDLTAKFNKALASAGDRLTASAKPAVAGKVVAVRGKYYVVNLGKKNGIAPKMKLSVYRLETIEGMKDPVRLPIGTLQVVSVEDTACVTSVLRLEPDEQIQVNDQVEVNP